MPRFTEIGKNKLDVNYDPELNAEPYMRLRHRVRISPCRESMTGMKWIDVPVNAWTADERGAAAGKSPGYDRRAFRFVIELFPRDLDPLRSHYPVYALCQNRADLPTAVLPPPIGWSKLLFCVKDDDKTSNTHFIIDQIYPTMKVALVNERMQPLVFDVPVELSIDCLVSYPNRRSEY